MIEQKEIRYEMKLLSSLEKVFQDEAPVYKPECLPLSGLWGETVSFQAAYTGTAFTQPLTDFFAGVLRPRVAEEKPEGDFPRKSSFEEWIEDGGVRFLWQPVFRALAYLAHRIHVLQSGYLHLYILAMVLTLLAMLLWAFLFSAGTEGGF